MSNNNKEETVREKLENLRESIDTGDFNHLYKDVFKNENKSAHQLYDQLGLGFAVENIFKDETKAKLKKIPDKKLEKLYKEVSTEHESVKNTLNFLD